MKYEEIKNHQFRIEITKEEMENAMLMPGEYIMEDGKYYTILGMLDGYIEYPQSDTDYTPFTIDSNVEYNNILMQDKAVPIFDPILKDDDII